jgi:hypothetical protein
MDDIGLWKENRRFQRLWMAVRCGPRTSVLGQTLCPRSDSRLRKFGMRRFARVLARAAEGKKADAPQGFKETCALCCWAALCRAACPPLPRPAPRNYILFGVVWRRVAACLAVARLVAAWWRTASAGCCCDLHYW